MPSWAGLRVTAPFFTRWCWEPLEVDCCGAYRCVCTCMGTVTMVAPSYPVSSIGTLFSPISNCAPVLCLQLPSIPRFYTVLDQAVRLPGGISLLSFVSDVAVFPDPSLLRDYGFDPFGPSAGGSHRTMAGCWLHPGVLVGPCCCGCCPETAAGCQRAPEEVCAIL